MSLNLSKVALVAVLALLTVTATSAFGLRGYFGPTSQFQAYDIGTSQLGTIYSFSLGDGVSVATNNFTVLSNPQLQNATVVKDTLIGSFSSVNTVAVNFQENIDVDPVKYPFFQVSVTTAPDFASFSGFAFGLRFVARLVDGSVVQLSNDVLPVEHVASGGTTKLRIYLLNYRPDINDIIGIRLYAEERAEINSEYSIHINSIVASSLNQVPNCSSLICFIPLKLANSTGYFDTLVADTIFTGKSNYNIAFSYGDQMFLSREYSNGSSHVSLTASSQSTQLRNSILASTPVVSTALYVISTNVPMSVQIQDLKSTFTSIPTNPIGSSVSRQTDTVLLLAELLLVFGVPAELLILRVQWRIALIAGIIMRLMIVPWTGHPSDTVLLIRTAYLYYHQGWAPIFYNPPTIFALSVPIGSMQFYYLLGLDRIDANFLFHYGGVLATLFVKLPFLLADVANAIILSRVSQNKTYSMFYFLNPFSIYVSAVWGQYEGLTTLALIGGYVATARLRPRLAILAGFGGFLLGGLVELFGFLVVPMLAVYLAIRKRYVALILAVSGTLIALLTPSSLNQFIFSFRISNPIFQPDIYSLSGSFGINSQLPFIGAVTVSAIIALYSLVRTSFFFSTLAPVSAAMISFELFAGNHPQVMLIPLGLLTLLFVARNDIDGLYFVWICGAVLAFISIAGTQSFAYLLTGIGYFMIPLIEGGQHLKFYTLGLLIVDVGLLIRAYRRLPLLPLSLLVVALVSLGWFLVNFV